MHYSLHVKFSNPKDKYLDSMANQNYGIKSYKTRDKVCEKCNYVHLVHCPINDFVCDRNNLNVNYTNKNRSRFHSSSDHQEISLSDKQHLEKDDEIKIEGRNDFIYSNK